MTSLGMPDIPPTLTGTCEQLMAGARAVSMDGVPLVDLPPAPDVGPAAGQSEGQGLVRAAAYAELRKWLERDPDPDPAALARLR